MNVSWANLNLKHSFEAPQDKKKTTQDTKPAFQVQEQDDTETGIQQQQKFTKIK
jgi:hypothetical protein